MELPFCKICGERHRLGHCLEWEQPPEVKHAPKIARPPKVEQHHQAQAPQEKAQEVKFRFTPDHMKQESMPVSKPRFDRNTYQRELMRRRREKDSKCASS